MVDAEKMAPELEKDLPAYLLKRAINDDDTTIPALRMDFDETRYAKIGNSSAKELDVTKDDKPLPRDILTSQTFSPRALLAVCPVIANMIT